MATLKDDIKAEIIKAMKGGDKLRVSTLRLFTSAIKNLEIEKREELTDEEVGALAVTLSKQRRESIEQFKKGGRDDLVKKEEAELEIMTAFMPPQLSEEEIEGTVKEIAGEIGAVGPGDMGKLMKPVMARLKGRADGKTVQDIVKKILSV